MALAYLFRPLGYFFFYLQSMIIFSLAFIINLIGWIYDVVTFKNSKRKINPLHSVHSDVFLTREQLVKLPGYTFDIYEFQTQDHAFVSLWRVKLDNSLRKNADQTSSIFQPQKKAYPVLIQHGLLDCSVSWFLQSEKKNALPYVLAAQGYDVWVGNNRGTKHSLRNSHLKDYWEYNFDHFVQYDQPTMIEGILKETKADKIIYIGHSQGSAQFIAASGVHQKVRNSVKCFIGMGTPVGLLGMDNHVGINLLSKFRGAEILKFLGFKTILVVPDLFCKCTGILIYLTKFYFNLFLQIVNGLCGNPRKNKIDLDRFGVIISQQPGGASVTNAHHWIQMFRSKKFCRYDYGKKKNIKVYGCANPPDYDLSHLNQIAFNCYFFKGQRDAVITKQNILNLTSRIPPERIKIIHLQDYAHLDYVWGMEAVKHVYQPIVQLLDNQIKGNSEKISELQNLRRTVQDLDQL